MKNRSFLRRLSILLVCMLFAGSMFTLAGCKDKATEATAAEASDVKNYIDSQAASGLSAIQSVSGENAVTAGDFIEVSVEAATSNKAVTLTSHANVTTKAVASATSSDNGLATAYDVKTYVDNATGALDSSITESDSSAYVSATIAMKDGSLDAADSSISVQYTSLTVAPGAVTVTTAGLATGDDVKSAVEGALVWTVLS